MKKVQIPQELLVKLIRYFFCDELEFDEDLLEEAIALHTVGKQANRIKCATIGWNAVKEMLGE